MEPRARPSMIAVALVAAAGIWWCATNDGSAPDPVEDFAPPAAAAPQRAAVTDPATKSEPTTVREQMRNPEPDVFLGSVKDPNGEPIPNATVRLHVPADRHRTAPLAGAATDAAGRFRIPAAAAWPQRLLLFVTAEGYSTLSTGAVANKSRDLALTWVVALTGVVRDRATQLPIAGALLQESRTTVHSDAHGRFALPGIRVGHEFTMWARKDGYAEKSIRVRLGAPDDRQLDVELERGTPLRVRVLDAETRRPIAGAEIEARRQALATTSADGSFVVHVVDGTELSLIVRTEGYLPFGWNWKARGADTLEPRIPMLRPSWIDGVVVDDRGQPIEGARARVDAVGMPWGKWTLPKAERKTWTLPGYAWRELPRQPPKSDAGGEFTIQTVARPDAYEVSVSHDDYTTESAQVSVRSPSARESIRIVLHRGATIRGRVTYNDEPWCGFLTWEQPSTEKRGFGRAGSNGIYEVRGVPAGQVVLFPRGQVPPVPADVRATFVVEAGKVYEHDFAWSEQLATITGCITAPGGKPLADVPVRAWNRGPEGYRFEHTKSGEDGSYTLRVARPHSYRVSVSLKAVTLSKPDIASGTTGVDFVLPALGKLRVQLRDGGTDAPIRRIDLARCIGWRPVSEEAFRPLEARLDAQGSFVVELPVGRVDLSIRLGMHGYTPKLVRAVLVTVNADPAPIRVPLERGLDVRLRLRGDSQSPKDPRKGHLLFFLAESQLGQVRGPFPRQGGPSNHRINGINMWVESGALLQQMPHFDVTGVGLLRGLAPGRYQLRDYPDGFDFEPALVDVRSSGQTIEIRWRPR